jgi:hypothetical protein
LVWENRENRSVEYFTLHTTVDFFVVHGTVIMPLEQTPTKITYRLDCDKQWRTRNVSINQERAGKTSQLSLKVSDKQVWRRSGSKVSFATGLFDVDLEISPATNTLPIRRIGLNIGESQEVDAVWVRFPSLKLERLPQRYTRIS